jgi:hypothetical protein
MRRSLWASGSLFVLMVAAVLVCPTSATVLVPLSDQELANRADVIVIGHAIARQTVWVGQDLATLVTVAVSESLKGAAGSTLTVALPGGIDRRRKIPIEIVYVGAPQISVNEEVILFLERSSSPAHAAYVVSGFSQGKLSIVSDPTGVKRVPRGQSLKRLSDVREEIRRHVEGGHP